MWEEFYKNGLMGIGWDILGDLSKYPDKKSIAVKLKQTSGLENPGSKKNDATACDEFVNKIAVGDIVIAKTGNNKLLGYGIVDSDYFYNESLPKYKSLRKVIWKLKGEWMTDFVLPQKTLTDITKYESEHPDYKTYSERLIAIMEDRYIPIAKGTIYEYPLNQILYGPPGTGKTYNSIHHAVAIVEGKKVEDIEAESKTNRDSVLDRFRRYKELGQIVFTTFHQSMSYEDFIEGIKPIDVEGKLHYEVKDGVFKSISDKALTNYQNANSTNSKRPFDEVWNDFLKPLIEGETIKVSMKKSSFSITEVNDRTIFFDKDSGESKHTLSVGTLKAMYIQGENQIIRGGLQPYYEPLLNELLNKSVETYCEPLKRFVLIIDEINRGNVSQIFGELITLIEEDKRLGKPEALTVTLPYSKNRNFGVPSNLYLVGTMNTADRSVEALDAALRRRFTFIEMAPNPKLIKDFGVLRNLKLDELIYPEALDDLVKVLEVINARIEKLLDKDHAIGHSYFMFVSTIEDLKCVFMNKIIPLLQEYFYGDIAKIGLVLGADFFEPIENISTVRFADFPHEAKSDLSERKVYRLKNGWNKDDEFLAAVKKIIGKQNG